MNIAIYQNRKWLFEKGHVPITSYFSCVCSPSLAALPSVFSKDFRCWEAPGNAAHGVRLHLLRWTRRARRRSRRWERESPGGLMSGCETGASRRTGFWWLRAAAGCSSAQGDPRTQLQTGKTQNHEAWNSSVLDHLILRQDSDLFLLPPASSLQASFSELKCLPAAPPPDARSLLHLCTLSKRIGQTFIAGHSNMSPEHPPPNLQLWLQRLVHLVHFTDFL